MKNRIDVGLFFFFVACSGVSIIVWIFNWICWLNQCCCCDFLHNPVNKRIAWWISFIFLLGMLACCISAFVSLNRFGFALDGALCSFDRIYYDFKNGQLESKYPKWTGFIKIQEILTNLEKIENYEKTELDKKYLDESKIYYNKYKKLFYSFSNLKKSLVDKPINKLNKYFVDGNINNITEFDILKNKFLKECHDYRNILFYWMKVLSMIYYCLFLITVTFAGVSMMFYACLKRQGYLITIMHVLWNIIRFFMFSFFIFGAAYGIFYLVLKDSVAVVKKLFSSEFLCNTKEQLIPCEFLLECIQRNYNFASDIDYDIQLKLQNFYYRYKELNDSLMDDTKSNPNIKSSNMINYLKKLCNEENLNCRELPEYSHYKGGIFGIFNCGFLENNLNMVYRTLYDASKESQILSALSLTSSFFGAIAIYFYLLVLHHYNNDLFFDSGKSIFRGFDGFGGGYKNKNRNQDPAYKKRKLRAEIELTSRNEDDNNYQNINKNEEDY